MDGDGKQKVVDLKPSVETGCAATVDLGKHHALFIVKTDVIIMESLVFFDDLGDPNGSEIIIRVHS